MKILLALTAIFEGSFGIGLLIIPVVVISVLLHTPLETAGGLFSARLCGAAIICIAICCWKARGFESHQAIGVVTAMLFYNFAAAAVLVYAGVRLGLQSPLLWPVIVAHTALGLWCGVLVWFSMRKQASSI